MAIKESVSIGLVGGLNALQKNSSGGVWVLKHTTTTMTYILENMCQYVCTCMHRYICKGTRFCTKAKDFINTSTETQFNIALQRN
jgi:hypothetical protein